MGPGLLEGRSCYSAGSRITGRVRAWHWEGGGSADAPPLSPVPTLASGLSVPDLLQYESIAKTMYNGEPRDPWWKQVQHVAALQANLRIRIMERSQLANDHSPMQTKQPPTTQPSRFIAKPEHEGSTSIHFGKNGNAEADYF